MKRLVLAVALVLVSACKRPGHATGDGGSAGSGAEARGAEDGWTRAKVKAYVEFQQGLLATVARVVLADGGRGPAPTLTDGEFATAEAYLRRKSGLSDDEIVTLNVLSATLMARQMLLKTAELTSVRRELLRAREDLPDGSVSEVDAALVVMEERKKRQGAYTDQRRQFGDALIDAALPFESALVQNWEAMASDGQGISAGPEERQ